MNKKDSQGLSRIIAQIYNPSSMERRKKARFWTAWNSGFSKPAPTVEDVQSSMQDDSVLVEKMETDSAFAAWFLNEFEAQERLLYLAQESLSVVAEIMLGDEQKASDRLKAAALINDLVKAAAPKQETKFADSQLDGMTPEQLEEFIEKNT